jgi:hypothetical protein
MMDKELKYLIEQKVNVKFNLNDDHVFIIGAYTDTLEKEKILVKCIKKLREFNIPIILCTHLPVRIEIQKLVDFYIYDEKNELLYFEDSKEFNLNNLRFINTSSYDVYSYSDFNHDFAVLTNIRNGFNFAKLNKKYFHYIEYDNIIDTKQYYQTFLIDINNYDAVFYEYDKNSIVNNNYCAAYLFSIKEEIASKMLENIKTLKDHYQKLDWRLENYILNSVKKLTNKIKISEYIDVEKKINICWISNRSVLGGVVFYEIVDDKSDDMYLSFVSSKEHLIEINYDNFNKFYNINGYNLIKIGKYKLNSKLYLKFMGQIFYEKKFTEELDKYKIKNKIIFK